jgi:uncharacterized protein YqgQ
MHKVHKKYIKFNFLPHKHYNVSIMESEVLMLYMEISDVSCENHTDHTNTTKK